MYNNLTRFIDFVESNSRERNAEWRLFSSTLGSDNDSWISLVSI